MSTSQIPQPLLSQGDQPQQLGDPSEGENHAFHANSAEGQQLNEAAPASIDGPQSIYISAQGGAGIEAAASEGSDLRGPDSGSITTDVSVEDEPVPHCRRHKGYRATLLWEDRRCTACAKYYCYEVAREEFQKMTLKLPWQSTQRSMR